MIRKFEQEAIVNQIMEGVSEKLDTKIEKAKKSADYKAVKKLADVVIKLEAESKAIAKKQTKAIALVNEAIENYNEFSTNDRDTFGLNVMNSYSQRTLSFFKNSWKIKGEIADKLAIALLDPMAQKRIKEIISAIVDEVALK
tara:strand:- start:540 stop:965 length:426 start_codon:yes stop_codon:yes gene_type:complete